MAKAYFRKMVPATPVWLTNGRKVVFSAASQNVGYFATENEFIITELRLAISENRGGVMEINQQEYEDQFVKKKAEWMPSERLWREEVGGGILEDTVTVPVTKQASKDLPQVAMEPSSEISRPAVVARDNRKSDTGEAKIKPRVGRRPKIAVT